MTDTAQPSATPAQPSADYQKTIRVQASPGALFDALTSVAGLTAWWARATGSGDAGGELRFFMNSPEPVVIHVDQATRPTSVQWTVTDCSFLPDWAGTRPAFTITPAGRGACELHFCHHGLTPHLDCTRCAPAAGTTSWRACVTTPKPATAAHTGAAQTTPAARGKPGGCLMPPKGSDARVPLATQRRQSCVSDKLKE